jgi:hypothetical protein
MRTTSVNQKKPVKQKFQLKHPKYIFNFFTPSILRFWMWGTHHTLKYEFYNVYEYKKTCEETSNNSFLFHFVSFVSFKVVVVVVVAAVVVAVVIC